MSSQALPVPSLPSRAFGVAPAARHARGLGRGRVNWLTPAWLVVIAALFLSVIGVEAIGTTDPGRSARQALFMAVGLIALLGVTVLPERWLRRGAWLALAVAIVLLVFVMLPGIPEWIVRPRNGSRRWISLGFTDLQPSELAKFAWCLVMADWLRRGDEHRRLPGLFVPFLITLVPAILILIEPDLGTTLLFVPALFAVILAAGAKKRHVAGILLACAIAAPLTYPFLRPHQRERIDAMVAQIRGDDRFAQDIGFQADRAMTVAGAGGAWGVGQDHARALIIHNALPEEHNDMIFAVIVCRWGAVGGALVACAVILFVAAGLWTAAMSRDPFGRLVVVSAVALMATQSTINIGMTVGLLPITGMTLPFVSYGGSSMVASWMLVGLILSVGLQRPRYFERPSFEFREA
ncbi:MAG: FtsW/RodA/SpoVE family cell cycle protein [Phycisphaeraceae bacterium]|nr:FtsW/RodA/SpoVE family cell cycle protein [Phycisphaeraceae bacterium]